LPTVIKTSAGDWDEKRKKKVLILNKKKNRACCENRDCSWS
jgi:hypothetical protein